MQLRSADVSSTTAAAAAGVCQVYSDVCQALLGTHLMQYIIKKSHGKLTLLDII